MTLKLLMIFLFIVGCDADQNIDTANNTILPSVTKSLIDTSGQLVKTRIKTPEQFQRVEYLPGSFEHYLQHFPLKPHGSKVKLYNGEEKHNQYIHAAVLDIGIGRKNIQQCADALIRLRAEYLWKEKRYEDIHFNFTNGFNADYMKWRRGNRIKVEGNQVSWIYKNNESTSYQDFQNYLEKVFIYAGTLSLKNELEPQQLPQIEIGDVWIQGGSPGHSVIVIDKAIHTTTGEILILLAQSYMPAQDIHILKNPNNQLISPWYSVSEIESELQTPEWRFNKKDLMKF
jgi:hypothetical protein